MKNYEIMFIVRPTLTEDEIKNVAKKFETILTDNGAEIIESKDWSKRRLAYEINDFREGIYHIATIEASDAAAITEFDRLAKISNDIIRHIIIKQEA